ncbi:MAG: pyridoxal 5'-phosphate synthase glutaminase subunit PdxT [Thaumarchaeota archaeon]|nr:pyridoxal 5'-phosphate synthase glutaminase subunit PdxT [Nitrososphaerota archaeon]|tara:strand:+ start:152 stop:772 length:621 start_codon:yes stop_codon:yes gene_type:complete
MNQIQIGILAIQGDIEENLTATNLALDELEIKGRVIPVKYVNEIAGIDGLILPGGESTVIGTLAKLSGATQLIKDRVSNGMPLMGTCAGMIMLAKRAYDRVVGEIRQQMFNVLDITVERNAFGRQNDSFEAELDIPLIGSESFKGVFIRSPIVTEIKNGVDVIATINNKIVAIKQGNVIGTSFHPELANDTRFHKYFTQLVIDYTK